MKDNLNTGFLFRQKSNNCFYVMSIVLIVTYSLQLLGQFFGNSLMVGFLIISFAVSIVSYVFAFKGFSNLKKANSRDDTAYPNTGKNFFNLCAVFCIVYSILSVILVYLILSITILQNSISSPSSTESLESLNRALRNATIIYGVVYGAVNIFSLNTVIGLYILRIFNIEKVEGKQNNKTLFTALFLLTSVALTVIGNFYDSASTADDTALTVFAGLFRIAGFIILLLFFKKKK